MSNNISTCRPCHISSNGIRIALSVLCISLGSVAMSAGDVRLGVQAALAFPVGDLGDGANPGVQGGGHAAWDLGEGHGIMGRADLTLYSKKNDTNITAFGVAGDYTYHFNRNQTGPYVLAGISYTNFNPSAVGSHGSDSGFGLDMGGGYELDRHLGLQARLTTNSADHGTMTSLNLGVTYRF